MSVSHIMLKKNNRTEIPTSMVDVATNFGLALSIILLAIHLIVFAVVDHLRNLPGKNLASFCVALLLEYSSTLISSVLKGVACYVNEIAAYYFIMASAFWMLTMSYDVWQTLRSYTNNESYGKQCKKFIIYSLWSWLMPGLLTLLVFFVLPRSFENFDYDVHDFDSVKCSFKETDEMYIFVTSVFGIILLLNTFFFATSVYYIFSTQTAVQRSTKNTAFITHFKLYWRLSLIMGVTWTAEFFIYYTQSKTEYQFDILSATFRIINTFEGLFIVIAFTTRKEVLNSCKSLHLVRTIRNTHFHHYISLRRV